jgi:ribosomal protein S18 acetylase RimI-like enzyme
MLVVRDLTEEDIDAVAALHVRTWQVGYAGIVPADVLDALDPAALAERRRSRPVPPGAQTVVAEDGGAIIGFALFGPYRLQQEQDAYDPAAGELYAIYVDPGRWSTGAGRALMAAAREALAAAGYPEFRLWVLEENHRARRFYERAGMAPDGDRDVYTPRGSSTALPEVRYTATLV